MDPANFPLDAGTLAALIVGPSRRIPWSDAGAESRFQQEVVRSYWQLWALCLSGQKPLFCDEVARLVNQVVLPNISDGQLALAAARNIFQKAGLQPTCADLEAQFAQFAQPRAPSIHLAQLLDASFN